MARSKGLLFGLRRLPIGMYLKFVVDIKNVKELKHVKMAAIGLHSREREYVFRYHQTEEGIEQALYVFRVEKTDNRYGRELLRAARLGHIKLYDHYGE